MELIQPAEISGKIMTLIDQAKKQIIIVSPYNKFTNWKKLTQRINKAKERGVEIKWYIRKNVDNNSQPIKEMGIHPIEIENLHCKLYLNEQHAIVTSMNLHEYSDSSSIDIGYLITDAIKYNELLEFIDIHIDSCLQSLGTKANHDHSTVKASIQEKNSLSINKLRNDNQISDAKQTDYFVILQNFLNTYKTYFSKISSYRNRYGTVLKLNDFLGEFDLIFETKPGYYRVDLRIGHDYSIREKIFEELKSKKYFLESSIDEQIEFGEQMKRLKIDISNMHNYDYDNWSIKEFEYLKLKIEKIIETYIAEINSDSIQKWRQQ